MRRGWAPVSELEAAAIEVVLRRLTGECFATGRFVKE
jgi:hypothetical protein